jgi:hypothetical protein
VEDNLCHQFKVKIKNYGTDLKESGLTKDEINTIKVSDLDFRFVGKDVKDLCQDIKLFIEKHEWLGKMPARPTHRFIATYNERIVAVLVMATPYAFSNVLGSENSQLEKLIARGASISWAPKNTGSWLIMKSIEWMVKYTTFRFFSGYSDTAAKELGTIYQSINCIYLGKNSGTRYEFFDPESPQRGWFNDRLFRKVGQYKKYALKLGYKWDKSWNDGCKMIWANMPNDIHLQLSKASADYRERCEKRQVARKHKYIYIKGKSKKETKALKQAFKINNPKLIQDNGKLGLAYPKVRGQ